MDQASVVCIAGEAVFSKLETIACGAVGHHYYGPIVLSGYLKAILRLCIGVFALALVDGIIHVHTYATLEHIYSYIYIYTNTDNFLLLLKHS